MRILYSHRIQYSRRHRRFSVEELITAFMQAGHEVRVVGPRFYAQSAFGGESRTVALIRRLLPGFLSEIAELAYNHSQRTSICAEPAVRSTGHHLRALQSLFSRRHGLEAGEPASRFSWRSTHL